MRELFSFIFDRITDPLGLPIEPWKEWIILLIIGAAAFRIAFRFVGDMYDSGTISGRLAGSFFHWLIRAIVFVAIWAVTYAVIEATKFVIAHWIMISVTAICMLTCGAIGLMVYRRMKGGTQNA